MPDTAMHHLAVTREEWLIARRKLLAREKEETRLRDAVNAERLALPWVRVSKNYRFQTPDGEKALADLFGGSSQLLTYHFMLAPDWEAGCPGCSFLSDHIDGALPHQPSRRHLGRRQPCQTAEIEAYTPLGLGFVAWQRPPHHLVISTER